MSMIGRFLGGIAYFKHLRGDIEGAQQMYRRAYARGMSDSVKLGAYGVLLLRKGAFDDALMLFNQALKNKKLDPKTRVNIRMNRALAYFKLGEVDQAIVALEDIHRQHKSQRVYQSLGYVYIMAGDYEKAEAYNREALEYDDEDPIVLDNMGQLYYAKGDFGKAREYYEKAYSYRKNQVDILYHLSLVEEHEGNMESAREYARLANGCAVNTLNDVTPDQVRRRYENLCGPGKGKPQAPSDPGKEPSSRPISNQTRETDKDQDHRSRH